MAIVRRGAHTPAADAKRAQTRQLHAREFAAVDTLRGHLRDSSILTSSRVNYDTNRKRKLSTEPANPLPKRRKSESTFASRLAALSHRIDHRKPMRYDVQGWKLYTAESIVVLQPYYTNSTPPHLLPRRSRNSVISRPTSLSCSSTSTTD